MRTSEEVANAYLDVLRQQNSSGQAGYPSYAARPLPRPEQWLNLFGPNVPLESRPLDEPREDTGQADPRLSEYPVAWNLQLIHHGHINWDILKNASEMPLPRACIDHRITEIAALDWGFRVDPKYAAKVAERTGRSKESVAAELRKELDGEIARAEAFWEAPDRKNDKPFDSWISAAVDEQLTHDALSIYPWMTYGGDLKGLWVLDGSTILPLRDETGGKPVEPYPAYQQILYGYPRGEYRPFTIEQDGQTVMPGGLLAGQLVYRPRKPRAKTPYGLGPTEQMLLDGLLYSKRFGWMLAEYTEGAMPPALMETAAETNWTPQELEDYERFFNDRYAGQTAERMRFGFLPPGLKAALLARPGERYRPEYDLHLVKLVCMHYLITSTELGFPEPGGLGSGGFHEGQEDINNRKSRLPDMRWWSRLITQISRKYLKTPDALEHYFLGLDEEDEAAATEVDHSLLADGTLTLNQRLAKIGMPAADFDEADMHMLQTARGVVFLEGASKQAPPGTLIEPASEINDIKGPNDGTQATSPTQRRPIKPAGGQASKEALAELSAFLRWEHKHLGESARNFRCEHLTEELAKGWGLTDDERSRIEFAKAGGGAPKDPGQAGNAIFNWSPYSAQG